MNGSMQHFVGRMRVRAPSTVADALRTQGALREVRARAEGVLGSGGGSGAAEVVLIRQLAIDVGVEDERPTMDGIARGVAAALGDADAGGTAGGGVLRFPNRVAYLAFVAEHVLSGGDPDSWFLGPYGELIGPDIDRTLRRLARAEPALWPEVMRTLPGRASVDAVAAWERGTLAAAEEPVSPEVARPLVRTVLGALAAGLNWEADPWALLAEPGVAVAEVAARYVMETRAAIPSWSDRRALGVAVADILEWLLTHDGRAAAAERGSVSEELHAAGWFDPAPADAVLSRAPMPPSGPPRTSRPKLAPPAAPDASATPARQHAPHGHEGDGAQTSERAPTSVPRGEAQLEDRAASGSESSALDRDLDVEAMERTARPTSAPLDGEAAATAPQRVAVREEDEEVMGGPEGARAGGAARTDGSAVIPPRPGRFPDLTRAAATDSLPAGPRGGRDGAVLGAAAGAEKSPTGVAEIAAAGLFFLVRPLVDLGLARAAAAAGIDDEAREGLLRAVAERAADEAAGGLQARLFASGPAGAARHVQPLSIGSSEGLDDLVERLQSQARQLGVDCSGLDGDAVDTTLELAVRQMVRWLRGLSRSSTGYALEQFVRTPGHVLVAQEVVQVLLPDSGYHPLFELAGYFDAIKPVPWWVGARLEWGARSAA